MFCCILPAQAEIVVTRSLEWLCDNSDAVGIYKIVENSLKTTNKNNRQRYTYTLQLSESLKGNPAKQCNAEFSVYGRAAKTTGDTVRKADEILVCFQTKKPYAPAIIHQINLSKPWHAGANFVAVDAKFNMMKKRNEIMTLVRSRLKHPQSKSVQLAIPPDSEAWKALWSGSSCFLLVPEDLKPEANKEKK